MATNPAILTETDPDDGQDQRPQRSNGTAIPEGLSSVGHQPLQNPNQPQTKDTYEVLEVDDAGQPIGIVSAEPEPQDLGPDTRMSEGEEGERPLLERNRAGERRNRRATQRQARDRTQQKLQSVEAENAELKALLDQQNQRLNGIEPRLVELGEHSLQQRRQAMVNRAAEAKGRAEQAQRAMIEAFNNQDGEAAFKALTVRDEAMLERYNAEQHVRQFDVAAQQRQQQGDQRRAPEMIQRPEGGGDQRQAPQLPPVVLNHIRDFQEDFPQFDPAGRDPDSRKILFLDAEVAREYDQRSPEYWDELRERMRTEVPHFFEADPQPRQSPQRQVERQRPQIAPQRRGPAVPGASERSSQPTRSATGAIQVRLTPGRRQALQEIGIVTPDGRIPDKAKFDRYMAQFNEFDRANSGVVS